MRLQRLLLPILLACTFAPGQTPTDGRAAFQSSDQKLNQVYKMLLIAKQTDTVFIEHLKASERIWVQFRNSEFTLNFPDHPSLSHEDSLSDDEGSYLARFTGERVNVLLYWLKAAEGNFAERPPIGQDPRLLYNDLPHSDVFVSDIKPIRSANFDGEIGIDKPSWSDQLSIQGKKFSKGIVLHPKSGGVIGYVEYVLPRPGGRLQGIAGCADQPGVVHKGKLRYRILVDNRLVSSDELNGPGARFLRVELKQGRLLRIEVDDGLDGNETDNLAFGDLKVIY